MAVCGPPLKTILVSPGEGSIIPAVPSNREIIPMLKKAFVVVIALCAFGSLGGVFLAGLNIYTRSTTPQEETAASDASATQAPADSLQAK
ncbi:Uncharacterised protein [Serratia ficaria]|uniref:Uncharacterized protein n=2 Tax=Serratia TaxID=613 RepID=A0A240BNW5_SERFI|nr:hypothetical protein C7332_4050 [Serratia ficaria]CAI0823619.1 Uncharacterised protein [Serratia ficaria]CAI0857872.1 Uncharacterised protein [Serratia ficaria]CAI0869972.1 Uncharacterised protein [Serratia ficaria]CAI0924618.1 Uncharacterised protein [Serratia ficaria]